MFATRKFTQIFVSFIVILTMMVNGFGITPAHAQDKDGIRREVNADSGRVSFIGPENGRAVPASQALGISPGSAGPANPAMEFAIHFAPEFGVQDPERDLVEMHSSYQDDGRVTIRYQQKYQNIPVLAGELIINTDDAGNFYSMSGEASPDLSLPTQSTVDPEQARETALRGVQKWYFETPAEFVASDPELWIFDESLVQPSARPPELVWRMDVTSVDNNLPIRELVLINAQTGTISLHFNQIDTAWYSHSSDIMAAKMSGVGVSGNLSGTNSYLAGTPSVQTYTANNLRTLPGTSLCNETQPACTNGADPHADAAHAYALGTYDLYFNKHGRDSLNNAGMMIKSTVHYDTAYGNAYWDGSQMVYGDGFGFPLADDLVTHELTHGITQYESNLMYIYQSGAINESLSDLWGEYYDQTNGLGNDDPPVKWLLGEDTEGLGAIRNMKNPPAMGDPDKMTSSLYYKGQLDNGGIHWNSGVNNKAVFLMVDGGTFNGKTVSGIGWDKTAAIYYEAQTNLLGSGSNYSDLYYALQQACKTLTGGAQGITLDDCINVKNALDAVQMNTSISLKYQITAPLCPAGMVPSTTLFEDTLEGGITTNWNASSRWSLSTDIANSPTHSMYGNDFSAFLLEEVSMKNGVLIQPNTYLHFEHAYDFDYYKSYYYDGGVLEYSKDGGGTWKDAGSLFSAGANYGGTILPYFGNALGGRKGFVGSSFSYFSYYYNPPNFAPSLVSSRFSLNSLAGQTVKIRFRFATDDLFEFIGWYIDDVKIYTCLGVPVIPVLQTPLNNALLTDYNPTLNWADSTPAVDRYHLQISTDSTFASTLYDETNLSISEFEVPVDLNENTKYYWRVRAFNAEDATNNWSLVRSFRTVLMPPELELPLDLGNPLTLRPTFTWTNPNGGVAPTNYTIQISSASNFGTITHTGTATGTSYTPAVNLPSNKQLYWRVRANGVNGPSAYSSPTISFFTPLTAPPAPSLTSPALGVLTTDYTPLFTWSIGALPGGTTVDHFQIQVDNNSNFSSPEIDANAGTVTNFTPLSDLASNTRFYWRVRTYNNLLEFSPWSGVRNVRTALTPPTLVAPANTLTPAISVLRPTFDWDDVPGATGYTIQVSKFPGFTPILVTYSSVASTFTPTVDLPKNVDLYWRVMAKGTNGPSAPSDPYFSFHTPTNPPATPILILPAANALVTTDLPTFSWTMSATSPHFDGFTIQVDDNPEFSSPETYDAGGSPVNISIPAFNTKIYWRVRAKNIGTSELGNWSAVRTFRKAIAPPTLTAPFDGASLSTWYPIFNWNDVPGASGYIIQVSTSPSFTSFVVNATTVSSQYPTIKSLPSGKFLYWRVRANGVNGPSNWSGTFSFITPSP